MEISQFRILGLTALFVAISALVLYGTFDEGTLAKLADFNPGGFTRSFGCYCRRYVFRRAAVDSAEPDFRRIGDHGFGAAGGIRQLFHGAADSGSRRRRSDPGAVSAAGRHAYRQGDDRGADPDDPVHFVSDLLSAGGLHF